ncbi:MAG: hypothetical protein ACKVWV_07680 [Planctomycetota bacterium]
MKDRRMMSRTIGLLAVAAGIAPGARATEPSVHAAEPIGIAAPAASTTTPVASVASATLPEPRKRMAEWAPIDLRALDGADAEGGTHSTGEFGIPNHPSLTDRFFLGVGAFAATSTTEARLDSPSGIGTTVDFEDVLGLESNDLVPQGIARWRFGERWRLELEHFRLDRSNTTQISGEIVWGDETFPVNSTLDTEFNVSVTRLSCGYSFYKRPDKELGIALGFHLMDIEIELSSGSANADDAAALAPLPVVSMYGQCALTDTWAVSSRLDAFRVSYDPYEGHVFSIGLDALFQPWRHVGMGFGWRSLAVEFSAEASDWEGQANSHYQGPIAFVSCSF